MQTQTQHQLHRHRIELSDLDFDRMPKRRENDAQIMARAVVVWQEYDNKRMEMQKKEQAP